MKILYLMLTQEIMPDQYLMEDITYHILSDRRILFHPCAGKQAKGRIPRQHLCYIVVGHRPDSESFNLLLYILIILHIIYILYSERKQPDGF